MRTGRDSLGSFGLGSISEDWKQMTNKIFTVIGSEDRVVLGLNKFGGNLFR